MKSLLTTDPTPALNIDARGNRIFRLGPPIEATYGRYCITALGGHLMEPLFADISICNPRLDPQELRCVLSELVAVLTRFAGVPAEINILRLRAKPLPMYPIMGVHFDAHHFRLFYLRGAIQHNVATHLAPDHASAA